MGKFSKASDDIQKIVNEISEELKFRQYGLDFEALSVNKAKEVVSISKANQVAEYFSNRDNLILIICFEEAFDKVEEKTKYIWLKMAMDQIVIDYENEKVSIGVPTVNIPLGFLEKYDKVAVDSAKLALYTMAQIEEERKKEKAEKEAQKKAKKKKKNGEF